LVGSTHAPRPALGSQVDQPSRRLQGIVKSQRAESSAHACCALRCDRPRHPPTLALPRYSRLLPESFAIDRRVVRPRGPAIPRRKRRSHRSALVILLLSSAPERVPLRPWRRGCCLVGALFCRGWVTAVGDGTVRDISRPGGPTPLRLGMIAADCQGSAHDEGLSEGEIKVLDARDEFTRTSGRYRDWVRKGGRGEVESPR
jgi:hypothetical protein